MQKQIVVINGTGGSGKDTFISFVSKYARVKNFSSIDKIKEIAKLMGWSGEKDEKARKFLSELKRISTEYNDLAYTEIKKEIAEFQKNNAEILFIHIREIEEIKRVVRDFSAKTLLIKRENLANITSNLADALVDNYNYDYLIINDSLENLNKKAQEFVQSLK